MHAGPVQSTATVIRGRHRRTEAGLLPRVQLSWTSARLRAALPCLAGLLTIAVLAPLRGWWPVQIVLVPILLTTPGVILLRALRVPGDAVGKFPLYIVCGSIMVLFTAGLAIDLIGPTLGVSKPLRTVPLLIAFEVISLGLLSLSPGPARSFTIRWSTILGPARHKWPVAVSLLAAVGALELNSGHSGAVATLALAACIGLLIGAAVVAHRLDERLLAVILYAVELALIWGFSLRGNGVYGFDISREYYDLTAAVNTGIWHTAHANDAYGALLSVTIMPAELHFLSGVPALFVFKVVYPVITALIPVGLFRLARNILKKSWAFLAAALFVAQVQFAEELPQLARQEIALILFMALLAVIIDARMPRWSRWTLAVLLSTSIVMAHYSTTYIMITLLALLVALQWGVSWLRQMPRISGTVALAFATSVIAALVWYGPVTHSEITGLHNLAEQLEDQGLNVLPNSQSGGLLSALGGYLQGNTQTPISPARYQQLAHAYYTLHESYITPLADAGEARYALQNAPSPSPPLRLATGDDALNFGAAVILQLAYVLAGIGSILMATRRKASMPERYIGLLGVGAAVFLILIRFSGTLAQLYNQERALMQAMLFVSISVCWALQHLGSKAITRERRVKVLAAGCTAVLAISTSSILGVVLGGGTFTDLANSGEDYERFDATTPELAAAKWLGPFVRPGQLVYADRYAQLPLVAMTGIYKNLISDVTPLTINQYAWVYAGQANVADGRARALFDDHTVRYVFPSRFLGTNFDLVFNDGTAEVFYR
jgi:uncharacterized membrane protein